MRRLALEVGYTGDNYWIAPETQLERTQAYLERVSNGAGVPDYAGTGVRWTYEDTGALNERALAWISD